MSDPIAYHITWRTYGSWLPGDEKGWVKHKILGVQIENKPLEDHARSLTRDVVALGEAQRDIVEQTFRDHCHFRNWELHAVNVRTNHVHVVVSAAIHPDQVMQQFKAWCSRRLNEATDSPPAKWWAIHGSTKWINEPQYLEEAIRYVDEGQ
jgi:REP element-mobilizing transposase RayT